MMIKQLEKFSKYIQGKPVGYFIVILVTFIIQALFAYPLDEKPIIGTVTSVLFSLELMVFWIFRVCWVDSVVLGPKNDKNSCICKD